MKSSARLALVLSITIGAILVPTAAATAASTSAVAAFSRVGEWPAGYVGNITVTNHTATALNGWRVEFDLPAGTRTASSYGGVFTRTGDHYVVVNEAWNGTIQPGASTTFGWVADGRGEPQNCVLNGSDCAGVPEVPQDYTSPTRTGALSFDLAGGVTLNWAPSTDDSGTVAYEVNESFGLSRKVTENRYVYTTAPALPPRIYVFWVRAIDAAGNASIAQYNTLGRVWRGDEPAAAPTGLTAGAAAPGLLRLSWTPVPPVNQISVPPTAGYEALIDGVVVGQTGHNSIIVPAPAPGQTVAVRAVNAVDQRSTPIELS
ncbi:cellulose binding domain-containing protein [Paractinoplanes rishiriensis]|uniref:CBM2 domain-containing protein n=1 Tax=Paractinoplanes rishiriensis TaxID=1050105 RepID=A0A919JYF1_9ACTN|nr:cellulose binding domain-containing protein [Actinoplanes rishiriensis]GIE95822.1 hypothetical protein Ari01nite_32870 [Actinoplanes rishiriensis]